MHHGLDLVIPQDPDHGCFVAKIDTMHRDILGHGCAMAEDKVVHDHGFMPGEAKEPDAVAADVSGTAGDENFHG
jgi:hypothetical protein